MNTLLKDLPEFAERIENNYSLKHEIKSIILQTEVTADDPYDKSTDYIIEDKAALYSADAIVQTVTEFINQNYTFKGK